MLYQYKDSLPKIAEGCFVAESAELMGKVEMEKGASVWYGAVLRGDIETIHLAKGCNVQDNSVIHTDFDLPVYIGENTTVGHSVTLHGCRIGAASLIGMGATILNGAEIGAASVVGAGSLVPSNKKYPDNSLILGSPAKFKCELSPAEQEQVLHNAKFYQEIATEHSQRIRKISPAAPSYCKLVVFIPCSDGTEQDKHLEEVKEALFSLGLGRMGNYEKCCWHSLGQGQFLPLEGSKPAMGSHGNIHHRQEYRLEILCPAELVEKAVQAVHQSHPYEVPALEVLPILHM